MHTSSAWISFKDKQTFAGKEAENALLGLSHLLKHAAPLFVMCDVSDLEVVPMIKAPHNGHATIFLYDKYPGGIGLSERIYEKMDVLLREVYQMAVSCRCESGCPSCIGTDLEGEAHGKQTIIKWLKTLIGDKHYVS